METTTTNYPQDCEYQNQAAPLSRRAISDEPRTLTFDESQQLLVIASTPEDQRNEEQSRIWQVWKERETWEKQRSEARRAEKESKAAQERTAASIAEYEYRQRLFQQPDRDSMDYFKSQLQQRPAVSYRLQLTDPVSKIWQYLWEAYNYNVAKVGVKMHADEDSKWAVNTIARWLCEQPKQGLIIRGGVGVGKTTMLYAMRDVLSIRCGVNLQIWEATKIAALGKGKEGQAVLEELCKRPLLGIDDLGTEILTVKDYGNDITPMVELLTQRYNSRLFTVITTNLTTTERDGRKVDEIAERYGERVADRLSELCNTVVYNPNLASYRGGVA